MARKRKKHSGNLFIKAVAVDNDTGQKVHSYSGDSPSDFERDFTEPLKRKFR